MRGDTNFKGSDSSGPCVYFYSVTGHIAYVLKQKFSQFSKRNYVDLILEWGPYTWPPLSKYDVFPALILFVFCITIDNPEDRDWKRQLKF